MKTDFHLDYETVLCGRAEVVHLALAFKAEKQASARQTPFAFGLVRARSGAVVPWLALRFLRHLPEA